jgi:hypothetical protein
MMMGGDTKYMHESGVADVFGKGNENVRSSQIQRLGSRSRAYTTMHHEVELRWEGCVASSAPNRHPSNTLPAMSVERRLVRPICAIALLTRVPEVKMSLPDMLGNVLDMRRVRNVTGGAPANSEGLPRALAVRPLTHLGALFVCFQDAVHLCQVPCELF